MLSFEQCFILFCNFPLLFAFVVGGLGFELCVFVAGWRHALRSEWPFIIIIIMTVGGMGFIPERLLMMMMMMMIAMAIGRPGLAGTASQNGLYASRMGGWVPACTACCLYAQERHTVSRVMTSTSYACRYTHAHHAHAGIQPCALCLS